MGRRKSVGSDGIWRPQPMRIRFTSEKLTASAGLGPLIDVFAQSPQYEELRKCVPGRRSNASYDPMQFIVPLMSGFWHDYDCLEDIEKFEEKPDLMCKFEDLPSARAIGDYLRSFDPIHFRRLNEFLTRQGFAARKALSPDKPLILDIDSTFHEQSGKKIEGLEMNYEGRYGLSSLEAFDELGFCYGFELRSGATFSSVGAPEMIRRIFSRLEHRQEKYFRGDSAFCNEDCIRACMERGALFTVTAHGNIEWEKKLDRITSWEPWVYTEEEKEKAFARKKALPEVELGSFLYQPSWSESLRFQMVVKRTRVEQRDLFSVEGWKYYAVLTNWNLHLKSKQQVIEHHSKRGNAENFIREKKIAFDLKHFPCLKLSANQAYGLIAMVAYNFLRVIAHLDRPDKPHYAKKLRHQYIFLPGKLVEHARQLVLKIPERFRQEVESMMTGWAGTLQSALDTG